MWQGHPELPAPTGCESPVLSQGHRVQPYSCHCPPSPCPAPRYSGETTLPLSPRHWHRQCQPCPRVATMSSLLSIPYQLPHSLLLWLKLSTSSLCPLKVLMESFLHTPQQALHPPAPQSPRPCQEGDSGSAESINLDRGRKPHSVHALGSPAAAPAQDAAALPWRRGCRATGAAGSWFSMHSSLHTGRGFSTCFSQLDTLPGHSRPWHQPLHATMPPLHIRLCIQHRA